MSIIKMFKKAFTLIELLIVVSIIGILISISIFGLMGARESARDAKRKSDLEMVRSGLELYKSDCGTYPTSITFPVYPAQASLKGKNATGSCLTTNTYIAQIPNDPVSGRSYSYVAPSPYVSYTLCASLEQVPSSTPNVASCGSCGVTCNYVVVNP